MTPFAFLIAFATTLFSGLAWADCPPFAGKWLPIEGQAVYYSEITVQYDAAGTLSIKYNSNQANSFIETYTADGQSHTGDGIYTGTTYTVTCKNSAIRIVRQFKELTHPLDTTFTLSEDRAELDYDSVVETDSNHNIEKFVRE